MRPCAHNPTCNDPLVLVHARALLTSHPAGRTAYLDADLRDPAAILAADEVRETLDLRQPVALSLIAIMHFVEDADDPFGIVAQLLDGLPSGSALILSHVTADHDPAVSEVASLYRTGGIPTAVRSKAEVRGFFGGLDLVRPGVAVVHRWRPDPAVAAVGDGGLSDAEVSVYGAVALKP